VIEYCCDYKRRVAAMSGSLIIRLIEEVNHYLGRNYCTYSVGTGDAGCNFFERLAITDLALSRDSASTTPEELHFLKESYEQSKRNQIHTYLIDTSKVAMSSTTSILLLTTKIHAIGTSNCDYTCDYIDSICIAT
jgi:hypothetical protein